MYNTVTNTSAVAMPTQTRANQMDMLLSELEKALSQLREDALALNNRLSVISIAVLQTPLQVHEEKATENHSIVINKLRDLVSNVSEIRSIITDLGRRLEI